MSDHSHRIIERRIDVAVVGGSAAGLAAALQLGRQRRSVIVVDSGHPRNAPAGHVHGYLGHEGIAPGALLDRAREEVRSYGVEVVPGLVERVTRADDEQFRLALSGGHAIVARRVVAATGLIDELPAVEGLVERWGGDVVHCPFCHGFEVRDRRVVQLVTHPMGLHPLPLYRHLTDRLVVVLADDVADGSREDALVAAGVNVVRGRARRLLAADDGRLRAVELDDGRIIDADVVAVGPRFHVGIEPFAPLGLTAEQHPSGLGDHVVTGFTGETSIPGLYAAGNLTDPSHQVLHAAADGSRVGAMVALSLATEDLDAAGRHWSNEADWDHRYSGEQIWSGNPNGTLVAEVADLAPGAALDIGAGEGGDAIWLAARGWSVTATDVSSRALARVSAAAAARELDVTCRHADANGVEPYEPGRFDLVSAQYASIPRTPDDRAIGNLLGAVAAGGTLLVVGHDLEPMRRPIDTANHSRMFDPDSFVRVDDVARVVAASPDWEVVSYETRSRPPGAASTHHVDDVVLRARRLAASTPTP